MNFVNPYVEIYFQPNTLRGKNIIPFYKEVIWTFLKNLDNRLKLFQHRLNIVITDFESTDNILKFGSIYEYRVKLDIPFNDILENERRGKLLNLINESFIAIASIYKWDLDVIKDAYEKSISQVDKFEYISESKISRDKQLVGKIKLILEGNLLSFYVEINDNNTYTNYTFKLFETGKDNLSWNRMFKEFGWFDKIRFGLKFLKGDLWIVINIENGQVEILKNPNKFDIIKIDKYLEELRKPAYKNAFKLID